MSAVWSPSRFILSTTKKSLMGSVVAQKDAVCALCAGPIHAGEPCEHTLEVAQASFNNKLDGRCQTSTLVCGACNRIMSREEGWMERFSKSFVNERGVFKIASNANQSHFILYPPKPPFVAFLSDGKMQHLIWRSRMTLDPRETWIRMGDRQLRFRHDRVQLALQSISVLTALMDATGLKGKQPFAKFDRELDNPQGTRIRPDVVKAAGEDPDLLRHIAILEGLSAGEFWAAGVVMITPKDAIEPPPLVG